MANPPMSDDRKKKLTKELAADCLKRGIVAMMKQNWDYSCEMFRQCVNLVPENLLYRQSLRGATQKKYNDNKTGASMAGMRMMSIKASIKKCRMSNDWTAVVNLCEDGLAINPWDHALMADLADALQNLGFRDVASWCIDEALKLDPDNRKYQRMWEQLRGDDDSGPAGILIPV